MTKRALELTDIAGAFTDSIKEMGGGDVRPIGCPWYAFYSELVSDIMRQNSIGQDNPTLRLHEGLPKPLFDGLVEWNRRSNRAEVNVRTRQEEKRESERKSKSSPGSTSTRPMSRRKF